MLRFLLQSLLILVVFFASWRFGGKPERHIASIYFSMLVLSTFNALVISETGGADYSDLQNVHLPWTWARCWGWFSLRCVMIGGGSYG